MSPVAEIQWLANRRDGNAAMRRYGCVRGWSCVMRRADIVVMFRFGRYTRSDGWCNSFEQLPDKITWDQYESSLRIIDSMQFSDVRRSVVTSVEHRSKRGHVFTVHRGFWLILVVRPVFVSSLLSLCVATCIMRSLHIHSTRILVTIGVFIYRVGQKTAHGFLCNNFACSQSFFIIFGTYIQLYTIGNLQLGDA